MNKYHAVKTQVDGIIFDSMKEAVRWQELKLLEKAGKIANLERQVPYELIPTQRIGGKTYRKTIYIGLILDIRKVIVSLLKT
jgi:hypothetical protein